MCHTRYLLASSPYGNGSYLELCKAGTWEMYTLHCSCSTPAAITHRVFDALKTYSVSRQAHERGYGSPEEIVVVNT